MIEIYIFFQFCKKKLIPSFMLNKHLFLCGALYFTIFFTFNSFVFLHVLMFFLSILEPGKEKFRPRLKSKQFLFR